MSFRRVTGLKDQAPVQRGCTGSTLRNHSLPVYGHEGQDAQTRMHLLAMTGRLKGLKRFNFGLGMVNKAQEASSNMLDMFSRLKLHQDCLPCWPDPKNEDC